MSNSNFPDSIQRRDNVIDNENERLFDAFTTKALKHLIQIVPVYDMKMAEVERAE
jgi:hypothetical protein